MRLSVALVTFALAAAHSVRAFAPVAHFQLDKRATVDDYVASEGPIALAGLLANIGPNGAKAQGASAGIVVASPSKVDPPYFFAWIRDSALVFKALIDRFVDGREPDRLPLILQYVTSQGHLQNIDNPSGPARGLGIGEPKFEVNETAFTGAWGRPQRDGPALRSTALITLANFFIAHNNASFVTSTLWPIIELDLNYVAANWVETTFDLWEEVQSHSFFTTAVQHRALREGVALAQKLGVAAPSAWATEAPNVLCFLQSYWRPSGSFIIANTDSGRSGLDVNTILASVHTFSSNAGCDAVTFQPCSDKALAAHLALVDSFRGNLYPVNAAASSSAAVAIGRYKEDVYFNGNPWYLATFAAAEQLYLALSTWTSQKSITVTAISQPFFARFIAGIAPGTYASSTSQYATLVSAIRAYADGFIAINQKFTPADGGLAEQFARADGHPLSAVDLTWSYASALTVFDRRAGVLPGAWPATGLGTPDASCADSGSATSTVTFNVNATTVFGENIFLTGSVAALRNWSPDNALGPLANPNYPIWTITVEVPANETIQYKYIRKNGGSVVWESDPNQSVRTAPKGGSVTVNDVWR